MTLRRKPVKHRGVRRHANGWLVEHGTTPRLRAYFTDRDLALAYKAHLVATEADQSIRLDRLSFLATAGAITRRRNNITPQALVNVALNEKIKRHPVSAEQWRCHARAALDGFAMLGLGADATIRPIGRDLGDRLVDALRARYPGSTVRNVIRMLDLGATTMWKSDRLPFNPFTGTETNVDYPVSHKTWTGPAPALTVTQSVAVLRALPLVYRPVMLTMLLTGMRIAETMALTVGDVNIEQRLVSITRQRAGSAQSVRNRTKSPASTRLIPICGLLADVLDRTITASHGRTPEDPAELEQWRARWLFIGVRSAAMDPRSVTDNIGKARRRVGLDSSRLAGKVKPSHDCRATFITECSTHPELASALLSRYVGHKTPRVTDSPLVPAATITGSYNRPGLTHLRDFVSRLETSYVAQFTGALNGWDLLSDETCTDPVSAAEAAVILGVTEDAFTTIAGGAHLGMTTAASITMYERDAVHALRDDIAQLEATSYPRTKVLQMLHISDATLRALVDSSTLTEIVTGDGTRRFRSDDVDALMVAWSERICRCTTWLRVSQAAVVMRCSADTVRRLIDEGTLSGWVDPHNGRCERFVDPDAVVAYTKSSTWTTTAQLASRLHRSRTVVEAALFRVRSAAGTRGPRDRMNDLERQLVIELLSARRAARSTV